MTITQIKEKLIAEGNSLYSVYLQWERADIFTIEQDQAKNFLYENQHNTINILCQSNYLKVKDSLHGTYELGDTKDSFITKVATIFAESNNLITEQENDFYETARQLGELVQYYTYNQLTSKGVTQ
ncbi:hypothetical protein [Brochothrix phage BtpYZU04]